MEAANSPHSLLERARAVPWAPHSLHSPTRAPAQPAETGQRGPRKKAHPGGRDLAALAPASSKALACTAALATVAPAGDRGILSWDPHTRHTHTTPVPVSLFPPTRAASESCATPCVSPHSPIGCGFTVECGECRLGRDGTRVVRIASARRVSGEKTAGRAALAALAPETAKTVAAGTKR